MQDYTKGVFVLEVDPKVRRFVVDTIKSLGLIVHGEGSADRYFDFGSSFYPADIVLLGVNLPGGARVLEALARATRTPMIIVLGDEAAGSCVAIPDYARSLGLDTVGVLYKPIRRHSVQRLIAKAITRAGNRTGARDLEQAIEQNQIEVLFQPKVQLREHSAMIEMAEALLHWNHPICGHLSPALEFAIAEKFGLIEKLTDLLLARAIERCAAWRDHGRCLRLAVNMSTSLLNNEDYPTLLRQRLRRAKLDPASITLGIATTVIPHDDERLAGVLKQVKGLGLRLGLDSRNPGASSLEQLQDRLFDEVKIDGSCLADGCGRENSTQVIESIINLATDKGIPVCADGIETQAAADWLRNHDCEFGQGSHFFPAVTSDVLDGLMQPAPGAA